LRPLISSIRLTIAKINPLSNAKKRPCPMIPEKNKTDIPMYHVITIASPPPFGIGLSCKLLSFGISNILFFKANCIIRYVRTNERNPKKRINNRVFNKMRLGIIKEIPSGT
jgi:hypothetical protein